MKTSRKQTAAKPTAVELLLKIESLARQLKTVDNGTHQAPACFSNYQHGATILFACQNVRDRMNGKDF